MAFRIGSSGIAPHRYRSRNRLKSVAATRQRLDQYEWQQQLIVFIKTYKTNTILHKIIMTDFLGKLFLINILLNEMFKLDAFENQLFCPITADEKFNLFLTSLHGLLYK